MAHDGQSFLVLSSVLDSISAGFRGIFQFWDKTDFARFRPTIVPLFARNQLFGGRFVAGAVYSKPECQWEGGCLHMALGLLSGAGGVQPLNTSL